MTIEELRRKIDALDRDLAKLLSDRVQCVIELQKLKRLNNLEAQDAQRENAILDSLLKGRTAEESTYIEAVYRFIFKLGRKL